MLQGVLPEISSFLVHGKIVFFNPKNGVFSFDKSDVEESIGISLFDPPEFSADLYSTVTICLQVSNACNFACDYCFNHTKSSIFMAFDDAKKVLDRMFIKFKNAEKFFVDVSGSGEPLLCFSLILDINNYCKKMSNKLRKEVLVMFVTNGLLLTDENVALLQENGILFGVSVDGCKKVHDAHRRTASGSATFELVMKNVQGIADRQYIGCAVTLTKVQFPLLETIEDLLHVFSTISIKPVRSMFYGFDDAAVDFWIGEYDRLCTYLLAQATKGDYKMAQALLNGDDYFGKFLLRGILDLKAYNRCDAGSGRISFDASGNSWCCPAANGIGELSLGKEWTVDDESCKKLYQKSVGATPCKCCEFRYFCGGECFVELFFHSWNPNKTMCRFNQALIKLALFFTCEIETSIPRAFYFLSAFCEAKIVRLKKDKTLDAFLSQNPTLSFVEGKRRYDLLHPKY